MPFLTDTIVQKILHKNIWIVFKPLMYHHIETQYLGKNFVVVCPVGFHSDGASVPEIPILYEDVGGVTFFEEGLIHDYVYRIDSAIELTREECDRLLFDMIMENPFASERQARIVYDGVRLGGRSSYHKKKVMEVLV